MQPHSLLKQQKRAADRSAACSVLARLRTFQGYLGAARFYQYEAARWHVRACELREQCSAGPKTWNEHHVFDRDGFFPIPAPGDIVTARNGRQYRITRYVPPVPGPSPDVVWLHCNGSKSLLSDHVVGLEA